MKAFWPNGTSISIGTETNEITSEQWDSLERLQKRHKLGDPLEVLCGMGYVGVMAGNMFIGIEPDGHSHT
jgi:hypothetical protein